MPRSSLSPWHSGPLAGVVNSCRRITAYRCFYGSVTPYQGLLRTLGVLSLPAPVDGFRTCFFFLFFLGTRFTQPLVLAVAGTRGVQPLFPTEGAQEHETLLNAPPPRPGSARTAMVKLEAYQPSGRYPRHRNRLGSRSQNSTESWQISPSTFFTQGTQHGNCVLGWRSDNVILKCKAKGEAV